MSHEIRARQFWPCNLYAQYVWAFRSMLEDINELLIAHEQARTDQARVTVLRYALVALHSFDQLTSKFEADLRTGRFGILERRDSKPLHDALSEYHHVVNQVRSDLAAIRHTLGGHRGLPSAMERKRFRKRFEAWGEWESTLSALEVKCERSRWQAALEAAFALQNVVCRVDLGQWYSTAHKMLRVYTPIRLAEPGRDTGAQPHAPHNQRVQQPHSRVTPRAGRAHGPRHGARR